MKQDANSGRLRRLGQAALSAESALHRADHLTSNLTGTLDELTQVIGRLDPSLTRLEPALEQLTETLEKFDEEIESIRDIRYGAEDVITRVHNLLDLIEWLLTPLFQAKLRVERAANSASKITHAVAERLAPPRELEPPVELPATVHRLAG